MLERQSVMKARVTPGHGILAIFFVFAGAMHFVSPDAYVRIMPPYIPWHWPLVYFTGVCEIVGGAGVLIPSLRRAAGIGLVALLIAVFPANVHMALHQIPLGSRMIPPVWLWLRLPLQAVLIAWVWGCCLRKRD